MPVPGVEKELEAAEPARERCGDPGRLHGRLPDTATTGKRGRDLGDSWNNREIKVRKEASNQ